MHKVGGGYYFLKIDLADAYINQIEFAPQSQQRLALSTLFTNSLSIRYQLSTGYFQEIMEQLTSDLSGVAVYLDDILVNSKDAEDYLHNF